MKNYGGVPDQDDAFDFTSLDFLNAESMHVCESIQSLERLTAGDACELPTMTQGISVVIPWYRSEATTHRLLDSLNRQTLPAKDFEVIIVVNGPNDVCLVEKELEAFSNLPVALYYTPFASAGAARNLGIAMASREYITFLDADDELGPEYLRAAYTLAGPDTVVVNPISNVSDEREEWDNPLNAKILGCAGTIGEISEFPWLLGFNACKTVPTAILKHIRYDRELRSGEDIVFFAHLLEPDGLKAHFTSCQPDEAYIRHLSENSVSRQPLSFDFAVCQRLDVIQRLQETIHPANEAGLIARQQLEVAQSGFVKRYLKEHPEEADGVENELAARGILNFDWSSVSAGKAECLVFCYCFSPFSDTSAAVAAKQVAKRRQFSDVILNNMIPHRKIDPSVSSLADRWIADRVMIESKPSFAGWNEICDFSNKAVDAASILAAQKGGYRTMYSRVLWLGSNVAAAMYKLRNPGIFWTAEFSDPLSFGVDGQLRKGEILENRTSLRLRSVLDKIGMERNYPVSSFQLVELVTFALADELIFTNENQMKVMIEPYPEKVQQLVIKKASIQHHPVPPKFAYKIKPSEYMMASSAVNIGFFGSFYENRGLLEVMVAIQNLPDQMKKRTRLHIFCNKVEETRTAVREMGLAANILVNPYQPYLEFLNVTTRFDVLLVNDVVNAGGFSINPFLPSKYSDYLGSGRDIWALVDGDSPLSNVPVAYRSIAGNGADILNTLKQIMAEKS